MKKLVLGLCAGATLAFGAPVIGPALAQIIPSTVVFPKGATGTSVSGTIKGGQIRDYIVRARAGQVLTVRLRGSAIVYFNVMPPGSQGEAIFVGSINGNSYTGPLPATGAYKIRVYQMRATARRGEVGSFRLSIDIRGRGAVNPGRPGYPGGPGGAGAPGRAGSITGIQGMDAVRAIDELSARGFRNVDSFSSGNTLYGIYYYRPARLCVQTTSAQSRIVDIRDIKTHPNCK